MFIIYKIVSPSGKCYVGMTKLKLSDRWDAHCTRAFRAGRKNHPFCCAIRKYGKAAFSKEVLEQVADIDEAKAAEIRWIAFFRSSERSYGYNISAGGDYDSETGKLAMREKRKDPEFDARYRANLSASLRNRAPESYAVLLAKAKEWRAENPRQVYENGRRAVRIATAAQGRDWSGVPGAGKRMRGTWGRLWLPSTKVEKARRAYFTKQRVRASWATLDAQERNNRGESISRAKITANASLTSEQKKVRAEQLALARSKVDRSKQAVAASAGQKTWWVNLRKDPERYATYIEARRAKLLSNLKAKSDIRHRERGSEESVHD